MLSVRLNRLVLRQTSYATRLISEVCRVGCGSSFILKLCVRLPEWHGWHAARRGLGSNLYRLGVPDMVKLENHIAEASQTPRDDKSITDGNSALDSPTIQ